jgi:hypothetical protein
VRNIITFALSNFTLTFLIRGFITAAISLSRKPRPWHIADVAEAVFSHFLLFSIGVSYFYNFVMHVFFGAMAARFIGWEDSPFQAEVGFASLGFSIIGFLAFRGGSEMRLAAVVGPAFFLWGAAGGHIYQMISARNFAPGNAGVIFYTDILLPIIGFALYSLWRRTAGASFAVPQRG